MTDSLHCHCHAASLHGEENGTKPNRLCANPGFIAGFRVRALSAAAALRRARASFSCPWPDKRAFPAGFRGAAWSRSRWVSAQPELGRAGGSGPSPPPARGSGKPELAGTSAINISVLDPLFPWKGETCVVLGLRKMPPLVFRTCCL